MTSFRPAWPALATLPLLFVLASSPVRADEFVLKDIRLEGLGRLSAASVYAQLPVASGDKVSDETAAEMVRTLFASGQFEDVQVLRDGQDFIVRVVERPSISGITLTGNQSIQKDELLKGLKSIGLAEGEVFKRAALDQVKLELQRQYAAQGRYGASVTADAKPLPRNRVALAITIKEGETARIKRISINGNQVFDDDTLLKALQLKSRHLLSFVYGDDKYSREKLTADLETLKSYYLDRGYLKFAVDSTQVSLSPDKDQVYIDINVSEGEPYRVADVRIAGELPLPEEELRQLVLAQPGQIYSQKVVTLSSELLDRRLGREGYLYADIQGVPELDDTTKTAKLIFYINPNRVMSVRRITFSGNMKTDDKVLRREMRQFESTQASSERIDLSKTRLQRLGYFSDVKIDKVRVPGTPDQIDLKVKVSEQPSGAISASVGFSQNAGVIFGANVSQNNFLGTGNKVTVGLNRSAFRDAYNLSFVDPYFTPEGISRGYNLYLRQTKIDSLNLSNFATDAIGGNVSFSYPIDETETLSLALGVDQTRIRQGVSSSQLVSDFILNNGSSIDTYTATTSWFRNTLNRGVFATAGGSQSVALEVAVPGSDIGYYKLTVNGQRFFPLFGRLIGRAHARLGYGDAYDGGNGLPFYRNFFGGGFSSVRGYRDFSMGPRSVNGNGFNVPVGGNAQAEGGLEALFPLPFIGDNNKIRASLFLDAGNVFNTREIAGVTSNNQLRLSTGLGLSWLTPIGPLTFALSRPLNKQPGDITQVFQFSLGQGF